MHRNSLRSELQLAKKLGFAATAKNSKAKNPYMLLDDGSCLLWLAGGLIAVVTSKDHFGQMLYRIPWKSSNGNKPEATITATEYTSDGLGQRTIIYYRLANDTIIKQYANYYEQPVTDVVMDHINHMRGDCRKENLRPATIAQNNQNRSKVKIERAFYTIDDLKERIASGEWRPITETVSDRGVVYNGLEDY